MRNSFFTTVTLAGLMAAEDCVHAYLSQDEQFRRLNQMEASQTFAEQDFFFDELAQIWDNFGSDPAESLAQQAQEADEQLAQMGITNGLGCRLDGASSSQSLSSSLSSSNGFSASDSNASSSTSGDDQAAGLFAAHNAQVEATGRQAIASVLRSGEPQYAQTGFEQINNDDDYAQWLAQLNGDIEHQQLQETVQMLVQTQHAESSDDDDLKFAMTEKEEDCTADTTHDGEGALLLPQVARLLDSAAGVSYQSLDSLAQQGIGQQRLAQTGASSGMETDWVTTMRAGSGKPA